MNFISFSSPLLRCWQCFYSLDLFGLGWNFVVCCFWTIPARTLLKIFAIMSDWRMYVIYDYILAQLGVLCFFFGFLHGSVSWQFYFFICLFSLFKNNLEAHCFIVALFGCLSFRENSHFGTSHMFRCDNMHANFHDYRLYHISFDVDCFILIYRTNNFRN